MALADVLPGVQGLTPEEKVELLRLMRLELARDEITAFGPDVVIHAGYGLYDERSCEGATVMQRYIDERKSGQGELPAQTPKC